jgi:hypothetical protein
MGWENGGEDGRAVERTKSDGNTCAWGHWEDVRSPWNVVSMKRLSGFWGATRDLSGDAAQREGSDRSELRMARTICARRASGLTGSRAQALTVQATGFPLH